MMMMMMIRIDIETAPPLIFHSMRFNPIIIAKYIVYDWRMNVIVV